ncbi:hypothetical protein A0J61_01556 [Choanephora cucurbitarum]|uniref:Uncharacterized protein n=1 Tax=Choanephora cucurbitarum TaxID=101091 RepID=A0A1C7NMS3_9FUNG|nr:hypothetical protein A0J61_01556 [Choanephora cucurbitarum]
MCAIESFLRLHIAKDLKITDVLVLSFVIINFDLSVIAVSFDLDYLDIASKASSTVDSKRQFLAFYLLCNECKRIKTNVISY